MTDNPIDDFLRSEGDRHGKHTELFKGNDEFIDQMTELSHDEVRLVLALDVTDRYLSGRGVRPVFGGYAHKFMRLQVSKERKSRGEYVEVNKNEDKQDRLTDALVGRLA